MMQRDLKYLYFTSVCPFCYFIPSLHYISEGDLALLTQQHLADSYKYGLDKCIIYYYRLRLYTQTCVQLK